MTKKNYFGVFLMATCIILTSCNTGATNNEVIELNYINTPNKLIIIEPQLQKKYQEIHTKGKEAQDMLDNHSNLNDSEVEIMERKLLELTLQAQELENEKIVIKDKYTIEKIFDRIKDGNAQTTTNFNMENHKDSPFYTVEVFYDDVSTPIAHQRLLDGYINYLWVFENNTIIIPKYSEDYKEAKMLKIQFDYDWFEEQVNQLP